MEFPLESDLLPCLEKSMMAYLFLGPGGEAQPVYNWRQFWAISDL